MQLFLAVTASAALTLMAGAARAELDGPVSVVNKAACITSGSPPATTCPAVPGLHYIVSSGFYAAHAGVLAPYRDAVQVNLQDVYAGDDPASPKATVALTFPDQATLNQVRAALLAETR